MHEVKRVLGSKKIILAFLLIFAGNILFYIYNQYSKSYDPREYKNSYNAYLSTYKKWDSKLALEELEKSHELYQRASLLLYHKSVLSQEAYKERLDMYYQQYPDIINEIIELSNNHTYEQCTAIVSAIEVLKDQLQYINTYEDSLENIKKQAAQMTTVSIFADKDSFSYKNIQKTVEDYAALEDAELTLGSDLAVNSFFESDITDYLILVFLILIALSFIEERKKGLWSLIHQGAGGRLSLGLTRTAIIFFSSIVCCCLLYGSKLLAALMLYGGTEDLNRLAQSMPIFKELWVPMSLTQLLWLYLGVKILGTFLIGMCLWLLVSFASYFNVAIASLGIFLGVEFTLYKVIRDSSILVMLKYVNVFAYIEQQQFFQHYMNLNLFRIPVQSGLLLLALTPVLLLLFIACALLIACRKYPISTPSLLSRALDRLRRKISARLKSASIFFNELYKAMVIHKGVVLLAILVVVIIKTYYPGYIDLNEQERIKETYMNMMPGPLTEETMDRLDSKVKELQQKIIKEEEALSEASEEERASAQERIAQLTNSLDNIFMVKSYGEELKRREVEEGIDAYFIPQLSYISLLEERVSGSSSRLLTMIALGFLVLLVSPILPYEKQRDMEMLLRASYQGREVLLKRKVFTAALATLLLFILVYGYELYSIISHRGGFSFIMAPVQNLTFLTAFPWKITILQYLLLFYGTRLILLLSIMLFVMALSLFTRKTEQAIALCSVTILLPSALSLMAPDKLKGLSLVRILGLVELISSEKLLGTILPILAVLLLGGLSLMTMRYKLRNLNR